MENSSEDKKPVGPELLDAVKRQIEYYFSKENLQNDKYLASQMDAQMSVPISVIMKFAKLKALTQDEEVVKQALVDSTVTVVDNRIKANIKAPGRSTIILRDIPTDATEEEVREIFNFPGCKNICSVRSDIGDTWFVVMDTEEDTKETVIALRDNKRTFRGKSVKARVKTEAVVRSFYPTNVPQVAAPLGYTIPYPPMMPGAMDGMMVHSYYMAVPTVIDPTALPMEEGAEGVEDGIGAMTSDGANRKGGAYGREHKGKGSKSDRARRANDGGANAVGTGRRNKDGKDKKAGGEESKPPIEVNALTFPPLGAADDRPVPTPGYKGPFQKYSFDDIIMIVKSVKEAALPADLNPKDHLVAMTPEINMDLLKRQRTFTIDETREQLRLGRPVQREAILPGAVDYRSMMYGDSEFSATKSVEHGQEEAKKRDPPLGIAEEAARREALSPPTVQGGASTTPPSPARISAATWAAMVRSAANDSAAAAPVTVPPKPTSSNQKSSNSTLATTPSRTPNAKSSSEGKSSHEGESREQTPKSKEGQQKRKKEHKEKSSKDAPPSEPTVTPAGPSSTDAEVPAASANESDSKSAAADGVSGANAPTWGGKTSFANVLKQAGDGPDLFVTKPLDSKAKTSDMKPPTGKPPTGNGVYTNSRSNSRNNVVKEKKSNADSEGMWVKEPLPALPEK